MPAISVIIPIYKAEKFIERCARSLFEQTFEDIEYIFVNDCTPDNSMLILDSVINEYPHRKDHVRIINHEINTGQSGARRNGMSIAKGDYIIHCDADDWIELDMYESMYQTAVKTQADAVVCDMVMRYHDKSVYLKYNNEYDDHQLMYECIEPISVVYYSMCNRLVSRHIFDSHSILPFDRVNMWDDVGLAVRIRYYIDTTVVINKAYYNYNKQNESSTTERNITGRIAEQVACAKYLEKFFIEESSEETYHFFISLLKIAAKSDLLDKDLDKEWFDLFPEIKHDLWKIRHFPFRFKTRIYLYLLGGVFGRSLYYMLRFTKQYLLNLKQSKKTETY